MEIMDLTFEEIIKYCDDKSINQLYRKHIRIAEGCFAGLCKYPDDDIFATIKQRDCDGIWLESAAAYCHTKNVQEFKEIELGSKISIVGILDSHDKGLGYNRAFIRLIDCRLDSASTQRL